MIERYLEYLRRIGARENTIISVRSALGKYKGYIRDNFHKDVKEAVEKDIMSYFEHITERLETRTVLTRAGFLRKFYKYCERQGVILYDPMEKIEIRGEINRVPKYVPDEKAMECLLNQPDEYTYEGIRDKAIMEVMYSTGIRREELILLKISDIDTKDKVVRVREGKGGKGRIVPIGEKAVESVNRYVEVTRPKYLKRLEEDRLFITKRGSVLKGHTVVRIIQKYRRRSKLTEKITPHSLRHACALHMLRGGASIRMVQRMLGHEYLSSTQIYTILYPKDLKEAHRKYHPRQIRNRKRADKMI